MLYHQPPLILEATRLQDALGTIDLATLPDPKPANKIRLKNATPLIERLWRIALNDIEKNIIKTAQGIYFGAGSHFGVKIFTRDISYSGILSLNKLYPEIMRQSLEFTRQIRLKLGLTVLLRTYLKRNFRRSIRLAHIPEEPMMWYGYGVRLTCSARMMTLMPGPGSTEPDRSVLNGFIILFLTRPMVFIEDKQVLLMFITTIIRRLVIHQNGPSMIVSTSRQLPPIVSI